MGRRQGAVRGDQRPLQRDDQIALYLKDFPGLYSASSPKI